MSDAPDNKDDAAPEQATPVPNRQAKPAREQQAKSVQQEADEEDEEKVMAGRHDVNYPAMLTKDVPGG